MEKGSPNHSFQGIDDSTEKLLLNFNIPMDCYLLTSLIAIHFDKDKFYSFFFQKNSDRYDFCKLLNFVLILPLIIIILGSGLIVFSLQLYILITFVSYQLDEGEEGEISHFSMKIILIIVFSMMIVPDYQTSVKKIAIGFKMTQISHKAITVGLSLIQLIVTLIVLVASILLIRITSEMEDLLQNFTALYVIIQINEIMFKFLSLSNMMNGLKCLGFKSNKIQHLRNIRDLWRRKRTIIEAKEKELRNLIDRVLLFGQIFLYTFIIIMACFVFESDYKTFLKF